MTWVISAMAAGTEAGSAFEGRMEAAVTRGQDVATLHYTSGANLIRIERTGAEWPHAVNLVQRESGEVTLVFPHNRTFVRLIAGGARTREDQLTVQMNPPPTPSRIPNMPQPPPGIGRQPPGMPAMPPTMPPTPVEPPELTATQEKKEILGYACTRYEIRQRGEVMEIWATEKLLPFHQWMQNQMPRFGPRMIEEQWAELLRERKLFPLLATLRFEEGSERMRFEVTLIQPGKIGDATLFEPPKDYHEVQPLPF